MQVILRYRHLQYCAISCPAVLCNHHTIRVLRSRFLQYRLVAFGSSANALTIGFIHMRKRADRQYCIAAKVRFYVSQQIIHRMLILLIFSSNEQFNCSFELFFLQATACGVADLKHIRLFFICLFCPGVYCGFTTLPGQFRLIILKRSAGCGQGRHCAII